LHFGKTGHFRKAGIAVPQSVYREDLLRLLSLIQYFQPRQLLVVGDLFHSRENKELNLFRRWRDDFPDLGIRLILGNHDILHEDWYEAAGITVSREVLRMGEFAFIHDITEWTAGTTGGREAVATGGREAAGTAGEPRGEAPYFFSGHLHPGIRIRGMGKQSLQFPCFYFGGQYAILPAFGRFTGTVSIDPLPESNVFAILPPSTGEGGGMSEERWPARGRKYAKPSGADPGAAGRGEQTAARGRWGSAVPFGAGSILQVQ
jgi:metallophosphoesterase superfamily enzyme